MRKWTAVLAASLALGLGTLSLAQQPAPPAPAQAAPQVVPISRAAFTLAPLRFEGHPELLTDEQRASLARAMTGEFPAALARKYPQAQVVAPETPGAVQLTPVVVLPATLSPFESATLRLDLLLPQHETRSFEQRFNLLQLWLAQQTAGSVAWDGALASLPPQEAP